MSKPLPRDCDGSDNGIVGITDFLALLAQWGPCAAPITGACCFCDDGSCSILTPTDCVVQGGNYQGDDSDCASAQCDPLSNCCFPHATSGCNNALCQGLVCQVQPSCCVFPWDQECVDQAAILCSVCAPCVGQ